MPTNLLRSAIIAQVTRGGRSVVSQRNFSSYRRHKGTAARNKRIRRLGLVMGIGTGYYFHGDTISRLEENRRKHMDGFFADFSYGNVDLREHMWPRLRKKTEPARRLWSGIKEKIWTGRVEEMWSDLSGSVDNAWSDLRGNMGSMWSDVREKMSSDRKS